MGPSTPAWLKQSASLGQGAEESDGLNTAFFMSVASDEQLVELLGFGQGAAGPPTHRSAVSAVLPSVDSSVCSSALPTLSQRVAGKASNAGECNDSIPFEVNAAGFDKESFAMHLATKQSSTVHLPSLRAAELRPGQALLKAPKSKYVSGRALLLPKDERATASTEAPDGVEESPSEVLENRRASTHSSPMELAIAFLKEIHSGKRGCLHAASTSPIPHQPKATPSVGHESSSTSSTPSLGKITRSKLTKDALAKLALSEVNELRSLSVLPANDQPGLLLGSVVSRTSGAPVPQSTPGSSKGRPPCNGSPSVVAACHASDLGPPLYPAAPTRQYRTSVSAEVFPGETRIGKIRKLT